FYMERHALVFDAMKTLYEQSGSIDEVTLRDTMKTVGSWERAGGNRTLAELLDRAGTTSNLPHYCEIVQGKAMIRRMIETARTIEVEGIQGVSDVQSFLDASEQSVFEVLEKRAQTSMRKVSEVVKSAIERIALVADSDDSVTGLSSGYRDLDKLTQGLQDGDLVIIAARPAMGKTSFVLNIAANAAIRSGASVGLFSLEMPAKQLATRLLATEARLDVSNLRGGMLKEEDWPRLTEAANKLHQATIFIDDTPGISPASIRAKCRRLKRQHGLDLVIIDYLQLMQSGRRETSREQEISAISRNLKGLAKDLSVPVLALSQLNRGVESRTDKRPLMSDPRESGAIEQDADLIAFIYREEVYNQELEESLRGIAELIVAKHRNGPTGTVKLKF
ncbi:MAG: replicative DNA helicase, partial [Myxococcota bacterium]|nr:replicative DNA helicase [Myxococcota bacterium]